MPRVSRQQADSHRLTIKSVSARLLRERGIKGVSVSELMAAAGLTHGGFYGHFHSKDALVAEACTAAFEGSVERWNKRVAGAADRAAARRPLIDAYLSDVARRSPGTSCPAAALAGDVARETAEAPVRRAYVAGLEALLPILAAVQTAAAPGERRRRALADFSTMVGGLMLARATAGHGLSDEFLEAAREGLIAPPKRARQRKVLPPARA
jgi:TetR/AcrR family transcriptional repressor of nem operon